MRSRLRRLLETSLRTCIRQGRLVETPLPDYVIEIPNNPLHGHFATNLPLTLAESQRRPPREIAARLLESLDDAEGLLEKAEIAGPGFLNFTISARHWQQLLAHIVSAREQYGSSRTGQGRRVMVEFVSANPTGPLHLGHGRGAALGDTLSRILTQCGFDVIREFYINDAGKQIRLLGESIYSRWKQTSNPDYPFPDQGYRGEYVLDLARKISSELDLEALPLEEAVSRCAERGREIMLEEIQRDLRRFRVDFDVWFSERSLFQSGLLDQALEAARERGQLYEEEGALWIRTAAFGYDKDRVLRKRDGQFTYFASDIAYHLDKRRRGVEKAINIWGADHHGYIPRMKAALAAYGFPHDWLSVILIQFARLWREGQEIKMSKRSGSFVTLQELMDEVGVDAMRFVFLTKSQDSPLDVDIDQVKRRDPDNPVYYVQYAHARICSIFRKAAEAELKLPAPEEAALERLVLPEELALIRAMAEFPGLLEEIARTLQPHRLTYYLGELAAQFHRYFNLGTKHPEHRVITDDGDLSRARLMLIEGVRTVIANGLELLGVHRPERM